MIFIKLQAHHIFTSRTEAISLELLAPLADSIIQHWDSTKFDLNLLTFEPEKQYNQLYEY